LVEHKVKVAQKRDFKELISLCHVVGQNVSKEPLLHFVGWRWWRATRAPRAFQQRRQDMVGRRWLCETDLERRMK
jgi:hypothetical protein